MDSFKKLANSSLKYRITNGIIKSVIFVFILGLMPIAATYSASGGIFNIFLYIYLGMLVLFVLISVWMAYLDYNHAQFKIDDSSMVFKEGRFSVGTTTIPYFKIQNASYNQSFIQKMFAVGNLSIQLDGSFVDWKSVDEINAQLVLDKISSKSNVIPIQPTK